MPRKVDIDAADDRRLRAAGALAAGAFAYWLPSVALVSAPARRLLGVSARIGPADAVALTFDDGPHPEGTPLVLAALAAAGARAAFFLVGEQVERFPPLARAVVEAGHEVGVHCHRHRNLMRLTPRQVRADLERAAAAIAAATGVEPARYRPPDGVLTVAAVAEASRRGWETVLWTRAGRDWRARATPESIAARLLGHVRAGDVLLLHDADWYGAPRSHERTAAALPLVLAELGRRGLRVEPLADLRE
jgi:peptidoglycan/xylan/chitin deacetylase (PgdA/CDA1 family)